MRHPLAALLLLLLAITPATAQNKPFSMLGTWLVKGEALSVGQSIHPEHSHGQPEPKVLAINIRWVIDKQSGNTFSGNSIGSSGTKEWVIGTLNRDGKRAVVANQRGGVYDFIVVDANTIDICYTRDDPKHIAAACMTGTRQ